MDPLGDGRSGCLVNFIIEDVYYTVAFVLLELHKALKLFLEDDVRG